jgi:16S rRNA (adenine1518-N6/adenine1519-N6)-dimethyltransferase
MARPKLGQHFLHKSSVLDRIAAAACGQDEPLVIEIGPGKGALTARLLARARRVVAIELDATLAALLASKFAGETRLQIVTADALATDLAQWGPAVLCGNLPYYIATAIVERAVRLGPAVPRSVFLIQKEVAERLTALAGTRAYGFLTVELALFAHSELLFAVPPRAFQPPPAVDSAVVRLTWRPQAAALALDQEDAFLRFVATCFRHKRKTVRNNLIDVYGKEIVDGWPEASRRAEQLTLARFAEMYRRLVP